MDPTTTRLKLRLLICNPKSYGPKNITVKGNTTTPRTREDPYLPGVYSYECKSAEEWQRLTTGVSRQTSNQNAFHAFAHFVEDGFPAGPNSRVMCVPGGVYEVLSAQCSVPSAGLNAGMIPLTDDQGVIRGAAGVQAMKEGYGLITPDVFDTSPATISPKLAHELQREARIEQDLRETISKQQEPAGEKEALIKAVQSADIQDPDWAYALIEKLSFTAAKGYLNASLAQLNETHNFSKEAFREELLERIEQAFQTGEDSQSGSAGEALVESEPTLSAEDASARQHDPSDSVTSDASESQVGSSPIEAPPAEAGTPNAKPKQPAKKAAAKKK